MMKIKLMKYWIVILSSLFLLGCATTKIIVIPEDKMVHWLPPHTHYYTTNYGVWLVPDARMQEILRKINSP